ncbi:DUF6326 family protein [Anaerolineales bacterium HSG24]|nr:DUF6326 family protein [Anaerolineales bacterium HSG24]
MNSEKKTATTLEDIKINVKIKLSALWITVMSSYIYNDIFDLYKPGEMAHIMAGNMGPFPTTQGALLTAMILMTIPTLMIFLSLTLKAQANRWTNIIVGILYIVVAISNVIGEVWAFYIFGNIVQVLLLLLIVGYAWKWPKQEA